MISVLVPSFRDGMLMRCFASMERSQPGSMDRVIVLDNGISTKLKWGCPSVRWVAVSADPFVFSRAYNLGAAAAPDDDIVSLGDDLEILTDRWLDRIEMLLANWPTGYGAITLEEERTREARPSYDGGLCELPDVALGAGLVIPRVVLDEIGPWEEGLVGYGFDDFDYGIRLFHAGYRLGLTDVVKVRNERQASAWETRLGSYDAVLDRMKLNHAIYHQKWYGAVPPLGEIARPTMAEHLNRQSCACKEVPR